MKWRSTVVLLVVACGLALYLYFVERQRPALTQQEAEKHRLLAVSADDVDRLHITHAEVAVTLEREPAAKAAVLPGGKEPRWRLTEPIAARASGVVCDQVARDLASLDWDSRLAGEAQDSQKLKERGLAEPRATLTVRHQGKEDSLEFGDDTPVGDRVYLRRRGGADLYEVRKSFLTSLLKDVDAFRDTTLLPVTATDVKKLSISRQAERLIAERSGRRWQLLTPFPAGTRADPDKVEEVLKKLTGVRVERFVADAPPGQAGQASPATLGEEALTSYGLATPVLVAELETGGGSQRISFGGLVPDHPDWRYAQTADGPSVYAVKADVAESLARPFLEFRDRRLTRLTADQVRTVTVVLAPAGANESAAAKAAQPGVPETATEAQPREGGASPGKPPTPAGGEPGARQPDAAAPIATPASPVELQTVELVRKEPTGPTPPQAEPVWRVTTPRDIEADADAVRELLRDVDARTVLDFVDLPQGAGDAATTAAAPAPAASTAAPAGSAPTTPATDLAPYGLDKPRATLTLTTSTGEKEVFQVGGLRPGATGGQDLAPTEPPAAGANGQKEAELPASPTRAGGLYLRRNGEATVLVVGEDLGRLALRGYLAYRTKKLTEVKREDVTHVRLERPAAEPQGGRPQSGHPVGGTVELSKEKNDWQMVAPIKKRAERTAVDDLLFELNPLHAESIVAEDVTDFAPYGLDKPIYRLEVEVTREGEKPHSTVVTLGAPAPQGGRFARLDSDGLVAMLPPTFVDRLDAEFRQRTVFTFDRDKVEELALKGVTPEVDAVKVGAAWQLRQPEGGSLDEAKVTALLDELKSLRVERWVTYEAADLSPYGLDKPVAAVSVRLGGLEPRTYTLALGAEAQGGDVFACMEGDPGVFLLPKRLLERVQGSLLLPPQAVPTSAEPTPEGGTPAPEAPADGPAPPETGHPESERPQVAPAPPSPAQQPAPSPGN